MLTTRLVVGKIYRANGDALTSSKIVFKLLKSSFISDSQIVKSTIVAEVDDQGNLFTVTDLGSVINGVRLWCNEQGDVASEYACYLPGNEIFKFTLPNGTNDINLSVLREAGITESDPQYQTLVTYINDYLDTLTFETSSVSKLRSEIYQSTSTLSALKAVVATNETFQYADKDNLNHSESVVGILEAVLNPGESARAIAQGLLSDNSFNFQLNKPIFLGNNGNLTQDIPTTGFVKQLAYPVTSSKIYVKINSSIIL